MRIRQGTTPGAAWAAFLLFAAVLGGSRAEASLPRAASIVQQESSVAVSTRESATNAVSVEALDTGSQAARFGFADELSLLGAESHARSFALFVPEESRCERTYAASNPVLNIDPDGRSWIVFNRRQETITLYTLNERRAYGPYPASNNPQTKAKIDRLAAGRYPFIDKTEAHGHPGDDDTYNGRFGIYGILRIGAYRDSKGRHDGVGLHAGRGNVTDGGGKGGYRHATNGCIRTCEGPMSIILQVIADDPLEYLDVIDDSGPSAIGGVSTLGPLASNLRQLAADEPRQFSLGGSDGLGIPKLYRVCSGTGQCRFERN